MKIDAGGQLCARKPHIAPNTATATTAVRRCPWSAAMTAMPSAAKAAMPPARPSRPSIRFTELTMPTIHSTVMGTAATPRSTCPRAGRATASTRIPPSAMRAADYHLQQQLDARAQRHEVVEQTDREEQRRAGCGQQRRRHLRPEERQRRQRGRPGARPQDDRQEDRQSADARNEAGVQFSRIGEIVPPVAVGDPLYQRGQHAADDTRDDHRDRHRGGQNGFVRVHAWVEVRVFAVVL